MDDYMMFAVAEAMAELFVRLLWFSCCWFVAYAVIGFWLKVKLVHLRIGKELPSAHRFSPVLISHILFSAALVNPYTMIGIVFEVDVPDTRIWNIVLIIVYFWVLAVVFECLLLRVLARWRILRWLQWRPPLKRVLIVSVLLSTLGFGAGAAGFYMEGMLPEIIRGTFPVRPSAFDWKVHTGIKPLRDASLPAESDRMIADDKWVYFLVNARKHQWCVVDRNTHEVVGGQPDTLGYILADDLGRSWQIRRTTNGLLCARISGENSKEISVAIERDVVFLEHQVDGLIIGANPSGGHLFALDPETGKLEWEVVAPGAEGNGDRRIGSIAGTHGVIVVGLWTSRVWAVNAGTGEFLWQFDEDGMGTAMHVVASPQCAIAFSRSGKAYAFDLINGTLKWSEQFGDLAGGIGEGNVCLSGHRVVFRDNSTVNCGDADSGRILWSRNVGNHYSGGVSCAAVGKVACASDRTLVMFDLQTGEEVFRTKFPVKSGIEYGSYNSVNEALGRIYAHPVAIEGHMYVFTSDGVLWALRL
jgi:outer membrane protein assembly factor BamB